MSAEKSTDSEAVIDLYVPFAEKDHAKLLGAKFNWDNKRWYIPQCISDITPFHRWLKPFPTGDVVYLNCPTQADSESAKERGAKLNTLNGRLYIQFSQNPQDFFQWIDYRSPDTFGPLQSVLYSRPSIGRLQGVVAEPEQHTVKYRDDVCAHDSDDGSDLADFIVDDDDDGVGEDDNSGNVVGDEHAENEGAQDATESALAKAYKQAAEEDEDESSDFAPSGDDDDGQSGDDKSDDDGEDVLIVEGRKQAHYSPKERAERVHQLYCSICGKCYAHDSFSAVQQKEDDDDVRYCLRHTGTSGFGRSYRQPKKAAIRDTDSEASEAGEGEAELTEQQDDDYDEKRVPRSKRLHSPERSASSSSMHRRRSYAASVYGASGASAAAAVSFGAVSAASEGRNGVEGAALKPQSPSATFAKNNSASPVSGSRRLRKRTFDKPDDDEEEVEFDDATCGYSATAPTSVRKTRNSRSHSENGSAACLESEDSKPPQSAKKRKLIVEDDGDDDTVLHEKEESVGPAVNALDNVAVITHVVEGEDEWSGNDHDEGNDDNSKISRNASQRRANTKATAADVQSATARSRLRSAVVEEPRRRTRSCPSSGAEGAGLKTRAASGAVKKVDYREADDDDGDDDYFEDGVDAESDQEEPAAVLKKSAKKRVTAVASSTKGSPSRVRKTAAKSASVSRVRSSATKQRKSSRQRVGTRAKDKGSDDDWLVDDDEEEEEGDEDEEWRGSDSDDEDGDDGEEEYADGDSSDDAADDDSQEEESEYSESGSTDGDRSRKNKKKNKKTSRSRTMKKTGERAAASAAGTSKRITRSRVTKKDTGSGVGTRIRTGRNTATKKKAFEHDDDDDDDEWEEEEEEEASIAPTEPLPRHGTTTSISSPKANAQAPKCKQSAKVVVTVDLSRDEEEAGSSADANVNMNITVSNTGTRSGGMTHDSRESLPPQKPAAAAAGAGGGGDPTAVISDSCVREGGGRLRGSAMKKRKLVVEDSDDDDDLLKY